jgi:hypothetical protein
MIAKKLFMYLLALIAIVAFIGGIEIYYSLIGYMAFKWPEQFGFQLRLFSWISFIFAVIGVVLLIGLNCLKTKNRLLPKFIRICFLCGMIISFVGIFAIAGIGMFGGMGITKIPMITRAKLNDHVFPLENIRAIAISDDGRIYLSDMKYGRIHVYDNSGRCLYGWFVDAIGIYDIWYENGYIHCYEPKEDCYVIYSLDGKMISRKEVKSFDENIALTKKASNLEAINNVGNKFYVEAPDFEPKVIKINHEGQKEVVIKNPSYLNFCSKPEKIRRFIILFVFFGVNLLFYKSTKTLTSVP